MMVHHMLVYQCINNITVRIAGVKANLCFSKLISCFSAKIFSYLCFVDNIVTCKCNYYYT